ncbi:MAG TPA: hypothetical protein VF111_03715, partial [Thermoanaerobaculia bacterium]
LGRRTAWMLLGAIVAMLSSVLFLYRSPNLVAIALRDATPEVLAHRSSAIIRSLGVPVSGSAVSHFEFEREYYAWLDDRDRAATLHQLREGPGAILYRTQYGVEPRVVPDGRVEHGPGRTRIAVDGKGRLAALSAGPTPQWKPSRLDWRKLHEAAGLDPASIRSATPRLVPDVAFDTRMAWSARYPGVSTPLHVEAATWRGTPVFFRVTGPWERQAVPRAFGEGPVTILITIVSLIVFGSGAALAWRNLRLRRGDRKGALRLAATVFLLSLVSSLLAADHRPDLREEIHVITEHMAEACFWAAVMYLLYIALEPYIRRRWPDTLIASTRLLAGNYRDPMVGRDILIGIAAGATHSFLPNVPELLNAMWGSQPRLIRVGEEFQSLHGIRFALARIPAALASGIAQSFLWVVVLVLMAILLRKRLYGALGLFSVVAFAYVLAVPSPEVLPSALLVGAILTFVAARFGLLAFAVTQATFLMIFFSGAAVDGSWTTPLALIPAIFLLALAAFAFKTALGSQSAFSGSLLED